MDSQITYNGTGLFSGQPTPFVSQSANYIQAGERWAQSIDISLNGELIHCTHSGLVAARDGLLSNLSSNFKELYISGIGTYERARIVSVNFSDADYFSSIPYTIQFECYPTGQFSEAYYVIDPSDQINYQENPDRTVTIQRSVSAKGINTSSSAPGNAIDNAKTFLTGRLAQTPVFPFIIESQSSNLSGYLISSQETIDRITNTVAIVQSYRGDLDRADSALVNRYTVDISEELGEFPVVTYNGSINNGRSGSLDSCFTEYNNLKNSISNASYFFGENVSQDAYINQLTYSFSFYSGEGASSIPKVEDDFTINISENSNSSLISASINGELRLAKGCIHTDYTEVQSEFSNISGSFHFDIARDLYEDFYSNSPSSPKPSNVNLNSMPLSFSNTKSPQNLTISYNADFNDRYVPSVFSPALTFDESISVTPPISLKRISEHYKGGKYSCQNLGYLPRQQISANINLGGNISGISKEIAESYINQVYTELGTKVENKSLPFNFSKSKNGKTISASKQWTDRETTEFEI